MKTSEQFILAYKNYKQEEQIIGTFWMNSDGTADTSHMLSESEMAEMLKMSMLYTMYSYSTGVVHED
jgi:hypothetical protein